MSWRSLPTPSGQWRALCVAGRREDAAAVLPVSLPASLAVSLPANRRPVRRAPRTVAAAPPAGNPTSPESGISESCGQAPSADCNGMPWLLPPGRLSGSGAEIGLVVDFVQLCPGHFDAHAGDCCVRDDHRDELIENLSARFSVQTCQAGLCALPGGFLLMQYSPAWQTNTQKFSRG